MPFYICLRLTVYWKLNWQRRLPELMTRGSNGYYCNRFLWRRDSLNINCKQNKYTRCFKTLNINILLILFQDIYDRPWNSSFLVLAFGVKSLQYILTVGTGQVPKFGRFWRFSSIFSIINEQICIKVGMKTGEPLIY